MAKLLSSSEWRLRLRVLFSGSELLEPSFLAAGLGDLVLVAALAFAFALAFEAWLCLGWGLQNLHVGIQLFICFRARRGLHNPGLAPTTALAFAPASTRSPTLGGCRLANWGLATPSPSAAAASATAATALWRLGIGVRPFLLQPPGSSSLLNPRWALLQMSDLHYIDVNVVTCETFYCYTAFRSSYSP